jgi:hypothetical protein
MITDSKLVARAERFVRSHKPDDLHPDVAARVAGFTRAKDIGASDQAVQAHARSLMNLADAIAGADVEDVEQIERRQPAAKKSAAKRTAQRTSSRRS